MKCKQGDYARIIHAYNPINIGRVIKVTEYIGKFEKGEQFDFRGIPCVCVITDHYWWVEGDELTIAIGPSPKAYIPDTWLEPIKPDVLKKKIKAKKDLDIFA